MNRKSITLKTRVKILDLRRENNKVINTALLKDLKIGIGDIVLLEYSSHKAFGGNNAHIVVTNESNGLNKTTYLQHVHDQLNKGFVFEEI